MPASEKFDNTLFCCFVCAILQFKNDFKNYKRRFIEISRLNYSAWTGKRKDPVKAEQSSKVSLFMSVFMADLNYIQILYEYWLHERVTLEIVTLRKWLSTDAYTEC